MIQTDRLNNILTLEEIKSFESYKLSNKNIDFIKEVNNEILQFIPQKAFNCAQLSALLGATIFDNSNIPVVVISGHLDFQEKRLFNCKSPIPYSIEKKEINEIWDGHCWVEIPNLIIDNSIFRTIYYGNLSSTIKDDIIEKFGEGKGSLISPLDKMNKLGFKYIPRFIVNQNQINGLIKSIDM